MTISTTDRFITSILVFMALILDAQAQESTAAIDTPITTPTLPLTAQKQVVGNEHITNPKEFFKISAFFIAFFGLYFVTVPLMLKFLTNFKIFGIVNRLRKRKVKTKLLYWLTGAFYFTIIVLPTILSIIWGMVITFNKAFSYQFGTGITLVLIFIIYIMIALLDWYGHRWIPTTLTRTLFISGAIVAFLYCFVVIFLPSYFTYNGTTAIFFAFNYMCASYLVYTRAQSKNIKLSIFVQKLAEISEQHDSSVSNDQLLEKIVTAAELETSNKNKKTRIGVAILYFLSFAAYALVIGIKKPMGNSLVGIIHVSLIIATDQVMYWMKNRLHHHSLYIHSDSFKTIYMLFTRIMCCFLVTYWLSMQAIIQLVTMLIIAINLTHYIIAKRNPKYILNEESTYLYELCPELKEYMQAHFDELKCTFNPALFQQDPKVWFYKRYLTEIVFGLYLALFALVTILVSLEPKGIYLETFRFGSLFNQWVVAVFSVAFGIVCSLFYAWFQSFKAAKYAVTLKFFILLIIIEAISATIGIIFYFVMKQKAHIIWTSFIILPSTTASFLLFLGIWISNDFFIYESTWAVQNLKQGAVQPGVVAAENTKVEDKKQDEKQAEPVSGEGQDQSQINIRNVKIDKVTFWVELKKVFTFKYRPQTRKDKQSLYLILANFCSLVLYLVLTTTLFSPWYIGFTIACWAAILELSIIILIKYYQTYFQFTFTSIMGLVFMIIIYVTWGVILGVMILKKHSSADSKNDLAIFCVALFGYAFLFLFIVTLLNFSKQKSLLEASLSFKISFSLSFAVVAALGLFLIIFGKYHVWGEVILCSCLYFIFYINLQKFAKWVNLAFGILIIGFTLFVVIYYRKTKGIILEGLSATTIVFFMISAIYFLKCFFTNRTLMQRSIFVYSKMLFPILEYNPKSKKMVAKNNELIFFFLSAFILTLWGLCASLLLPFDKRYLGVSITALAVSVTYIYTRDRVKNATYIQLDTFEEMNINFFIESLQFALDMKQQWRNTLLNTDQPDQIKNSHSGGSDAGKSQLILPPYAEVMLQLQHHKEWATQEKVLNKSLGGIFKLLSIGVKVDATASQAPIQDPRLQAIVDKAKTSEEGDMDTKIDALIEIIEIKQVEQLWDVQFWAFFGSYMLLKKNQTLEDQKCHLTNLIQAYKVGMKDNTTSLAKDLELSKLVPYLLDPTHRVEFQTFMNDYNSRDQEVLKSRANNNNTKGLQSDIYNNNDEKNRLINSKDNTMRDINNQSDDTFSNNQNSIINLDQNKVMQQMLDEKLKAIAAQQEEEKAQFVEKLKQEVKEYRKQVKDKELRAKFEEEQKQKQEEFQVELDVKREEEEQAAKQWCMEQIKQGFVQIQYSSRDKDQRRQQGEEERLRQEIEAKKKLNDMTRNQEDEKKRKENEQKMRDMQFQKEQEERDKHVAKYMNQQQNLGNDPQNLDALLQGYGDQIFAKYANTACYVDKDFTSKKALAGRFEGKYQWARVADVRDTSNQNSRICVFDSGASAVDIRQGALGDCYLLSAMSVIAHSAPSLLYKVFHARSQNYSENGLYVMQFFRGRKPIYITIDDYFPSEDNCHPFVDITSKGGNSEIWPMLIEKAYAKMYGSYDNIWGGFVDTALAEITNGASARYDLQDKEVIEMYKTGELWEKIKTWVDKRYLMGASTTEGSDTHVSDLGIVQGHAYSLLDAFELEGNKLVCLRNPWGNDAEWKGSWGDSSLEWTERRKRIVYDRMKSLEQEVSYIGENDGIFWMGLSDFMKNYILLYLCRTFNDEWAQVTFDSEWSQAKKTAGGCRNNKTVGENPQVQLYVIGNQPVEVFIVLSITSDFGIKEDVSNAISFQLYDLNGERVDYYKSVDQIYVNNGGHQYAKEVSLDKAIKPLPGKKPYTLLFTNYEAGKEAKFNCTIYYKKSQGTVSITEI